MNKQPFVLEAHFSNRAGEVTPKSVWKRNGIEIDIQLLAGAASGVKVVDGPNSVSLTIQEFDPAEHLGLYQVSVVGPTGPVVLALWEVEEAGECLCVCVCV